MFFNPTYQSGGAIRVNNEQEARNYPVAPGNSVLFIDGTQPRLYAKTASLSPVDPPLFEVFRLVREENPQTQSPIPDPNAPTGARAYAQAREDGEAIQFVPRKDFDALRAKFEALEELIQKKEG
ncbi:MAG: hypothetical protein J5958_06595 [Clostridia bacterium]|nr:hypothetical protein [Clostridia bacterium]